MNKLIESSNDPVKAKLSKMHCAAILTLGFEQYTGTAAAKVVVMRENLMGEIARGRTEKPFWRRIDDEVAEKRRKTGDTSAPAKRKTSDEVEDDDEDIVMPNDVDGGGILDGNRVMAKRNEKTKGNDRDEHAAGTE